MSARILVGLVVGLLAGAACRGLPSTRLDWLLAITAPVGQLWLDALTMTVVPLVFGLLVTGVASATSSAAAGGVAARAMLWFVILLLGACALSAATSTAALTLAPIGAGQSILPLSDAAPPTVAKAGAWFGGLIPANPVKAAAEMSMVPIVVFALFFGFATSRIEPRLREPLTTFFEAVVAAMLVIVQWVLQAGPAGVLALGFGVGAKVGLGAAGALLHYIMIVVTACLAVTLAAYALVSVIGRTSPSAFAKAALPVQVVALGTQSSLACLPAMVRAASVLRASPGSAAVVLPLAVSIFRAASAAANIAVTVYLAHLHGVVLSPASLAIGVMVAAAVSLAAVGLPAQVSFFATIGPVCLAMGVPLETLPILLAVETIPDIFRTLGNVTSDLAVTRIVGRDDGGAALATDDDRDRPEPATA